MGEAARERGPFVVAAVALAILAWVALALGGHAPHGRFLVEAGLAGGGTLHFTLLFVAGWTVMVVAMMLPTSLPLVAVFERLVRHHADRRRLLSLLLAGYLLVWLGFGFLALGADALLHAALRRSTALADRAPLLGAGLLLLAGAYQFTPLKHHCLTKCRTPKSFVLERWRGRNRALESLRVGLDHGVYCVGCCWTLMLLMFVVGLGSLGAMLALGVVMGVEKNAPWGRRIGAPLGAILLAAGLVVGYLHLA